MILTWTFFVSAFIYRHMDGEFNQEEGKKGKGKALEAFSQESLDIGLDPFKEYNCYIKQPQLRQDDCPNVISWYGGK